MTKESLEPGTTSIPMTGSTMRDSVPVTATAEIVTMETTTGYTHQSSTPATNISSAPSQLPSSSVGSGFNMESFAVDFTISNLIYTAEMGQPDTKTFSNTKEVLQNLLNPLFESGSIGSYYSGCKLTTLRPVKNGTAVNFLCTYWKLLTIPILDKKKIYWELSKQTRKITRLGPHILEKKSLYINGYSDRMTLSSFASCLLIRISTPAPSPVSTAFSLDTFTLNFTITNLRYTTGMSQMGSSKFNSVDNALERLLGSLFAKTTLGSQYVGCKLILLRPLKEGTATGVIFACARRIDPASPELDREELYWELSSQTWNFTRLGPYILDEESLYINGYNHLASTKFSGDYNLKLFSLNFSITNLLFTEDMGHPGSGIFNSTERTVQHMFNPLFKQSSIGSSHAG